MRKFTAQEQAWLDLAKEHQVVSSSGSEHFSPFIEDTDITDIVLAFAAAVAAQMLAQGPAHDLYTDADKDRPEVICDSNGQVVLGLCKKCGKGECELTNEDGSPSACSPHSTIPTDGWKQEYDLLYRSDEKGSNCDEIWVKQFDGARTMAARKDGAAELLLILAGAK